MAYLTDGYQTLIAFTAAPGLKFKEKEVTAPDMDIGEVDTTTMRNVQWRTRQPKHLATLGTFKVKVQYDPIIYSEIVATLLGVNNTVVITFPDGHTLTFWGALTKFTPDALKEGEFPLADLDVTCTNQDNTGATQPPVYA